MDRIEVWTVDVFTDDGSGGNPAGVVADATGLQDADMQSIAASVGASETAFIFPAQDTSHDVFVRFFTPEREVPVCGHATLAAHVVLSRARGDAGAERVQRAPGAVWRVRTVHGHGTWHASMVQEPVQLGPALEGRQALALYHALGTRRPVIAPMPRVISTGHAKVVVPIANVDTLRALAPDADALRSLSRAIGVDGWFVFALADAGSENLVECRMFAPSIGLPEDPVNGSGHGPLAAYLFHHGLLDGNAGRASFVSRMGVPVGRPGLVHVTAEIEDGNVARVHVGGEVRPAARAVTVALTCSGVK